MKLYTNILLSVLAMFIGTQTGLAQTLGQPETAPQPQAVVQQQPEAFAQQQQQTQADVSQQQQPRAFVQQQQQPQAFIQQQPSGFSQQQPQVAAAVIVNPNTQLISELQAIMNRQAQMGQYPGNNPVLSSLQQLINQHSAGGGFPPAVNSPQIQIVNRGPGVLMIGQYQQLQAGMVITIPINGMTPLVSMNAQTNIEMRNVGVGVAKFWDVDDQRHSFLRPNAPSSVISNLGHNQQGFHLE